MVEAATALSLAAIVALVSVSAFFSSTEIAVFSLAPARVAELASTDRGRALGRLREDPHRLLVTLLVGNTLVNMAVASIATVLAVQTLPANLAVPAATFGGAAVVLIFGEIIPKSWGLGNADSWAVRAAPVVRVVELVLLPLVVVADFVTRRYAAVTSGEPDIEELVLED